MGKWAGRQEGGKKEGKEPISYTNSELYQLDTVIEHTYFPHLPHNPRRVAGRAHFIPGRLLDPVFDAVQMELVVAFACQAPF